MEKKLNSWPMLTALLCSYSVVETPLIYHFLKTESIFFQVSNIFVSLSLILLTTLAWWNQQPQDSKSKKMHISFWTSFMLFSSLPFGIIGPQFLIFFKLLRFAGLFKAYNDLNKSHDLSKPKRVMLIGLIALIGVHLVACTWLLVQPMTGISDSEAYIKSLYWAVTTLTTTGYGDITPTNDLGRLFTMFVMLTGFSAFGIMVGNISNLLMAKNRHLEANREKIEDLSLFMEYYKVPRNLKTEVMGYYSHRLEKRLSENDSNIISDLPHGLQKDLQIYIKMKLIDALPIFQGLSQACLKRIAEQLEALSYSSGDILIKKGEVGEEMFLIDQGEVEVLNDQGNTIAIIKHGQCVGEMALLTQSLRTANVVAKNYCDVYRLTKIDFISIGQDYPELEESFHRIMVRRVKDKAA